MSTTLPHKRTASELDAAQLQPGSAPSTTDAPLASSSASADKNVSLDSSAVEPPAKRPATESTMHKAQVAVTAGLESVRAQTAQIMQDVHMPSSLLHAQEKIVAGAHSVKDAVMHGIDSAKASMHSENKDATVLKNAEGMEIKKDQPSFLTQAQEKGSAALASASVAMHSGMTTMKETLAPMVESAKTTLTPMMDSAKVQMQGLLNRESSALPAASADSTKAPLVASGSESTPTDNLKVADKSADASHSKEKDDGSLPTERCDDEFPGGKHESDSKIGSESSSLDASATKPKRATRGAAGKKAAAGTDATATATKHDASAVTQAERDVISIQ